LAPLGIPVLDASHAAVREAADPVLRQALAQVRDEAPVGSLGANVVLRPVVERALIPTVAYAAGPGELAYAAQVAPVAAVLGAAVPLFVPRWSGEVVDRRVLETAAALGLEEETLASPHGAETAVAHGKLDAAVADALERLRLAMEAQVALLGRAVQDAAMAVPPSVVERLGDDLARRLARQERRLVAAVKRQEGEVMRQVAMVRGALRPYGGPPERTLSLVPLLVRYGAPLLEQMGAAARGHARALVRGPAAPA
jgi:uncharacterized protein YllA (UPF0747 family)